MPRRRRRTHDQSFYWRFFTPISLLALLAGGVIILLVTFFAVRDSGIQGRIASASVVSVNALRSVPETAFTSIEEPAPGTFDLVREQIASYERVHRVRFWTPDGRVVFDSLNAPSAFPDTAQLDQAVIQGRGAAQIKRDVVNNNEQYIVDIYLPAMYDDRTVGAVEVTLDYETTRAMNHHTLIQTGSVVAFINFLVWATLISSVARRTKAQHHNSRRNALLALHDELTGLPNRRYFTDRLTDDIDHAVRKGGTLALLLLDMDRFKDINDSLGHDVGDDLLRQAAARLSNGVRDPEGDTVARLGGDEFAVILPDLPSVQAAEAVARRLRDTFTSPFILAGMPIHVNISIGVAAIPDHAQNRTELMRLADVAMYTAKTNRTGVAVYATEDDDSSQLRLQVQSDLRAAIDDDTSLILYYQPQVNLLTGDVIGYEALVRWVHPEHGIIPPSVFVPLAEQTDLIVPLSQKIMHLAAAQIARWRNEGHHVPVSVNLSAHDITDPEIVSRVRAVLDEHAIPAHLFQIEITETAVMTKPSLARRNLAALRDMGITLAIDDYGVGTTTIAQMRDWPVSIIKIDRAFVADLSDATPDSSSWQLIRAIFQMACIFNLDVIAEGVETADVARALRTIGVQHGQGYLWSPPRTPAEITPLLAVALADA